MRSVRVFAVGLALAWAYAAYLLCQAPSEQRTEDRCGTCDACLKNSRLTHADLHFSYPTVAKSSGNPAVATDYAAEWRAFLLERPYRTYAEWMVAIGAENKQGNITVAECHAIIQKLSLTSVEGGPRVLLMWLPEYLREAGNTLLKIMEEPPEGVYFLLVAERSEEILVTIRSRTQPLRVPPLPEEAVATYLEARHQAFPDAAASAARLAGGHVPLAIELLAGQPDVHFEQFTGWMRLCCSGRATPLLKFTEKQAGIGREALKQFFAYGMHLVRQCLMHTLGQAELARTRPTEAGFVGKFAPFVHAGNVGDIQAALEEAILHVERNANARLVLITLSLRMHRWLHLPAPVQKA